MLDESRKLYANIAARIPNHKQLSQMELAEKYEEGGPDAEAYLAALIIRYWNIPLKLANKDRGLYDENEAYDWYINSLLYVLKDKPWKNENGSVYNDPRAIEKALNTCVKCDRANWFQASNRHKRKINHGLSSLETLSEEYSDAFLPDELLIDAPEYSVYEELVIYYFNRHQYLMALMIDVIVYDVKLESITDDRALALAIKKSIKSLPSNYNKIFSQNYGIPQDIVDKSFEYIYNMSDTRLKQSIEDYIHVLRIVLSRGK